jgi:hypothetical protein
MFKLFVTLLAFFLVNLANSFACSMEVDQIYTKNQLMGLGASYHEVSVASVSGLSIADYTQILEGGNGWSGDCPDYLTFSGRVSFSSSASVLKKCQNSVVVSVKLYIGNAIPDGPVEDINFSDAQTSCTSQIQRIPIIRKLPLRIQKPIIVKGFPQ